MAAITIAQICDAIETTLAAASGMNRTQSYDELTEGISAGDLPLLQVYWERLGPMDPSGGTDRLTYQGVVRHKLLTFHADVYAAQRSHIDEDMKKVVNCADAMLDVLEQQNVKPYFGLAGIKAWQLESAAKGAFEYTSGPRGGVLYMGVRFILVIHVF